MAPPAGSGSARERAAGFLAALDADAGLVPENLRTWWRDYLRNATPRYLDSVAFIDAHRLGPVAVEVGSVPGHFAAVLKHLDFDVRSVDLNPDRLAAFYARHGVTTHRLDVEQQPLPFDDASVDLVLAMEIIEHLRINPLHPLREAWRVLKPGGRLFLSTPNITPMDRLRFLFGRDYQGDPVQEFRQLETLGFMGHVRLYSVAEVRRLVGAVGFVNISSVYRGKTRAGPKTRPLWLLDPWKARWREYVFVLAEKPAPSADSDPMEGR